MTLVPSDAGQQGHRPTRMDVLHFFQQSSITSVMDMVCNFFFSRHQRYFRTRCRVGLQFCPSLSPPAFVNETGDPREGQHHAETDHPVRRGRRGRTGRRFEGVRLHKLQRPMPGKSESSVNRRDYWKTSLSGRGIYCLLVNLIDAWALPMRQVSHCLEVQRDL